MTIPPIQVHYTVDGVERVISANKRVMDNLDGVARASLRSHEGFRKLSSGVSNLALSMVGLQGPTGKVAEGLLLLGAGGAITLGVAAGLAIIGAAYSALTKRTREAKKANDDLIQSFIKAHDTAPDEGRHAAELEAATLRAKIAHIEGLPNIDPIGRAILGLAGKKKLLEDLDKALANDTKDRAIKATKSRLEDELALQKIQFQTEGELNKQLLEEDLISRDRYFEQRISIAQRGTAAEIGVLTGELKGTRGAERAHLERMIQLRAREGEQEILNLQIEHRMLDLEEERGRLAAQRALRIAHANQTQGAGGAAILPSGVPPILQGAVETGLADAHGQHLSDRFAKDREAAKALGNEIRFGLATALTDFVSRGVSQGNILLNLFQSLLQAAQQIASMFLQKLFFTAIGGQSKGNTTPSGGHADGGLITGPGTGTSDSIGAWLSNGEFVVNAAATAQHIDLLQAINGRIRPTHYGRFASGGLAVSGGHLGTLHISLPDGVSASVESDSDRLRFVIENRRAIRQALG